MVVQNVDQRRPNTEFVRELGDAIVLDLDRDLEREYETCLRLLLLRLLPGTST